MSVGHVWRAVPVRNRHPQQEQERALVANNSNHDDDVRINMRIDDDAFESPVEDAVRTDRDEGLLFNLFQGVVFGLDCLGGLFNGILDFLCPLSEWEKNERMADDALDRMTLQSNTPDANEQAEFFFPRECGLKAKAANLFKQYPNLADDLWEQYHEVAIGRKPEIVLTEILKNTKALIALQPWELRAMDEILE